MSWFWDKVWDNGIYGPGYRSKYKFNWGKLTFVIVMIAIVFFSLILIF